ncbi:MAG: hypothetical protein JWR00_3796 [Rubritepida sp.]|nr:hypothetical protein [Rubritepida sp.]
MGYRWSLGVVQLQSREKISARKARLGEETTDAPVARRAVVALAVGVELRNRRGFVAPSGNQSEAESRTPSDDGTQTWAVQATPGVVATETFIPGTPIRPLHPGGLMRQRGSLEMAQRFTQVKK